METDADAQLMEQVARGDGAAFAALVERYQASVVRLAYRYLGDAARAEDMAQEIFLKLYRTAHRYRPSAKFKTFLFRVASNHCLNEVRRPEHQAGRQDVAADAEEPTLVPALLATRPDEELAARELEGAVGAALRAMSDRERLAFSLCRFEGLAYKDIAQALGCSEAAVKSLIHRATLAVAQALDALALDPAAARSRP